MGKKEDQEWSMVLATLAIVVFTLASCSFILPKTTVLMETHTLPWAEFAGLIIEDTVDWIVFLFKLITGV